MLRMIGDARYNWRVPWVGMGVENVAVWTDILWLILKLSQLHFIVIMTACSSMALLTRGQYVQYGLYCPVMCLHLLFAAGEIFPWLGRDADRPAKASLLILAYATLPAGCLLAAISWPV